MVQVLEKDITEKRYTCSECGNTGLMEQLLYRGLTCCVVEVASQDAKTEKDNTEKCNQCSFEITEDCKNCKYFDSNKFYKNY